MGCGWRRSCVRGIATLWPTETNKDCMYIIRVPYRQGKEREIGIFGSPKRIRRVFIEAEIRNCKQFIVDIIRLRVRPPSEVALRKPFAMSYV